MPKGTHILEGIGFFIYMARPERKNVDYFPHYISDGKKMFYIEQKYGNDGYATWFKILETLAITDDHFINLNNEMDLLFLSSKCKITTELLINILNDLSVLKEIDHFLWLNKIVYSHKFIESIQDAYFRRNNKCMTYESFCNHYHSLCSTITQLMYEKKYINTQSKVKYIKSNETKEDINKFNFKQSLLDLGSNIQVVEDWLLVRKSKKAVNTETALAKFLEEKEKLPQLNINQVLELCVEKSWSGFKADWYLKLNNEKQENTLESRIDKLNSIVKNADWSSNV